MAVVVPDLFARVALDIPGAQGFDYTLAPEHVARVREGSLVLVPWGSARRVGLVEALCDVSEVPPQRLRNLLDVFDDAPEFDAGWRRFVAFVARYYHRGVGEVALPAIPKLLRVPPSARARGSVFARARARWEANAAASPGATAVPGAAPTEPRAAPLEPGAAPSDPGAFLPEPGAAPPEAGASDTAREPAPDASTPVTPADVAPTPDQARALARLTEARGFQVLLLHGVTGSGKTEVYLRWLATILARDPAAQVLLLVPEIALTPQLFGQIANRFPDVPQAVLHSDLADGDRATQWLAAADGRARLVVGTRLAVLAPMPRLAAIVVDEEHDPSYKQQEGVRYSARDLAIALASERGVPVALGSATPSLETWFAAQRGRYALLPMPARASGGVPPVLRVLDPRGKALRHGLAPGAREAIERTLARGEQALVFMNRRGYAPVLTCEACGWLSRCDDCSAYRVLHRVDGAAPARADGPRPNRYRLVCHHCGAEGYVPRACPDCGNVDLTAMGRGTQRLEEGLRELYPDARIARVDRDVARRRGAASDVIAAAHAGRVDILVGTQMLAKGHDFRRLTLVVVVDADAGLYSSDFRAPERLFALLMQVAGRAGRSGRASEFLVQTRFPSHPMFAALARHDYDSYAATLLAERRDAGLPPFVYQALLRAEARTLDDALGLLRDAKALADDDAVQTYDPVPMPMMRIAGRERAQLLVESASRPALHAFLERWLPRVAAVKSPARWQLDVDPQEI